MASLADTPDLVGFFSYSREDDEGSGGRLSKLRERIQEELRAQLGRTKRDFRLWQDKVSISQGELWEDNIRKAVAESVFYIPIITPTAIKSRYCKFEFETFLAREKELERSNLVFPILYIQVPGLMGDSWREDPLLVIIGSRQYEQWQNLRHLDPASTEVALRVEKLCENISKALQQPWMSPQERREAEARRVAEDERRRQEQLQEAARRVAEEERRRREAAAQQAAEDERRREEKLQEQAQQVAAEERRAAAAAMNQQGNLYLYGKGVTQDYAEAKRWYEKAAAAGNSAAMNNIGYVYAQGKGVTQDHAKAKRWYEKAAAAGNSAAMNNIGYQYFFGNGVTQDYAEAKRWYEKAAAAGNSVAMNNIGDLYAQGNGVTQDYAEAKRWFEEAAAGGYGPAMIQLGDLYRDGLGVTESVAKARTWYQKAAAGGDPGAQGRLDALPNR
jgi:TPR repeat protein